MTDGASVRAGARSRRRGQAPSEHDRQPGPLLVGVVGGQARSGEQVQELAADLDTAVDAGCDRLLVDLSEADRLSTRTLNVLLGARQRLIGRGGRVVLVLHGRLRRTFELLGLDRRFDLVPDRTRASRLLGIDSPARAARDVTRHAA